jgi:hypothetical protein
MVIEKIEETVDSQVTFDSLEIGGIFTVINPDICKYIKISYENTNNVLKVYKNRIDNKTHVECFSFRDLTFLSSIKIDKLSKVTLIFGEI